MAVTLKQLETFVWVADLSSFHKAAERLNTTQPNISARIANLEGLIGKSLFDRQGGQVHLSRHGAELLPKARQVLAAQDAFLTAANDATLTQGVLRLGVTEMVVHSWLRPFVQGLKAQFPKVVVELTVDMAADLELLLHKNDLDLALINGPFQFPASATALGQYPMAWVAAPALGLAGKLTAQDLLVHPILTHARGTWPHLAVAEHFQTQPARLVPSSNLAACLQMTVEGMGVALIPRAMAERDIADGRLTVLDYPWTPKDLEFEARFSPNATALVRKAAKLAAIAAQANK